MINKLFTVGERVTYVDIIHAVVMRQQGHKAIISYWGKGELAGQQVVISVDTQWLEHGWNEIKPIGEE